MTDQLGKRYVLIPRTFDFEYPDQAGDVTLVRGESSEDLLIFTPRPDDKATSFRLILPGKNVDSKRDWAFDFTREQMK